MQLHFTLHFPVFFSILCQIITTDKICQAGQYTLIHEHSKINHNKNKHIKT